MFAFTWFSAGRRTCSNSSQSTYQQPKSVRNTWFQLCTVTVFPWLGRRGGGELAALRKRGETQHFGYIFTGTYAVFTNYSHLTPGEVSEIGYPVGSKAISPVHGWYKSFPFQKWPNKWFMLVSMSKHAKKPWKIWRQDLSDWEWNFSLFNFQHDYRPGKGSILYLSWDSWECLHSNSSKSLLCLHSIWI